MLREIVLDYVSVDGPGLLLQLSPLVVVVWLDVIRGFLDLAVQALLARLLDGQVSDPLPLLPFVVDVLESAIDFLLLVQVLLTLEHLREDLVPREEIVLDPVLDGIQYKWEHDHHEDEFEVWFALEVG